MIKGTADYLDQICQTHLCPEHGKKLAVAWHAGENSYVLRCGEGHYPLEVTREMTQVDKYKAGEREQLSYLDTLLPRTDLATGELLMPEAVQLIVQYAEKYQLDPYRGHVVLMYGKPYIGFDGFLYHAARTSVPYTLQSRPLTPDERKTYRIGEDDHAWVAEVIKVTLGTSFTGLGVVTNEEINARSKGKPEQLRSPVVAKHPWQIAQKRAEWQGMRRAFPIGVTEDAEIETKDEKEG